MDLTGLDNGRIGSAAERPNTPPFSQEFLRAVWSGQKSKPMETREEFLRDKEVDSGSFIMSVNIWIQNLRSICIDWGDQKMQKRLKPAKAFPVGNQIHVHD